MRDWDRNALYNYIHLLKRRDLILTFMRRGGMPATRENFIGIYDILFKRPGDPWTLKDEQVLPADLQNLSLYTPKPIPASSSYVTEMVARWDAEYPIFATIAQLAQVPAAKHREFGMSLRDLIGKAKLHHQARTRYGKDRRFQEINSLLQKLAKAVSKLDAELDKIDGGPLEDPYAKLSDPLPLALLTLRPPIDEQEEEPGENWTAPIIELADSFAFLTCKKSGAVKNLALRLLTQGLWQLAHDCGGHLPFNKHAGENDPTTRGLRTLESLLPKGLVPKVIPYGTLDRLSRPPARKL